MQNDGVAFNANSAAYVKSEAFAHDHGFASLRKGCAARQDSLEVALRDGPRYLGDCMLRCSNTTDCGAVLFHRIPKLVGPARSGAAAKFHPSKVALEERVGMCVLQHRRCLVAAEQGPCASPLDQSGTWCAYQLLVHRPQPCDANGGGGLVAVRSGPGQQVATPPRAATPQSPSNMSILPTPLSGGLNNMLLQLSAVLHASCVAGRTLALPAFAAEGGYGRREARCDAPIARRDEEHCHKAHAAAHNAPHRAVLSFAELFNVSRLARGVWPCRVLADPPSDAHDAHLVDAPAIVGSFGRTSPGTWEMVRRVYAALYPSGRVSRLVASLHHAAGRHGGRAWSAVHLPIQEDWWWTSGMCRGRQGEGFTRRCYAPAEVAEITHPMRRKLGSTGTLLLYPVDQLSSKGPPVCFAHFGNATVRLQLPGSVSYTMRSAAEMFLAAEAPAGFFGNAFSTFSKAVALLRARRHARPHSYSIDCALAQQKSWAWWARGLRSSVTRHPGFGLLETSPPASRCERAQP